jgi:hydroxyquinol 1,2-dioxygenase
MRPAHIHFMISADGHRRLITHLFVAGSRHLDSDAVFGVRPALVTPFTHHDAGTAANGTVLQTPWYSADYSFTLVSETS